jgi:glutaredoxin/glutathione-dependent peroxiredoxin
MEQKMIKIGDRLPDSTFKVRTDDGYSDVTTADVFSTKKVVLFAVPGAFTPTCTVNHLPGYLENHDEILAKGVDAIAVVAVNDHHVMNAWAKSTGGMGKLIFLADGSANFTRAIGLDLDMSGGGMGVRSKRYSMIVEDGVVKNLNVEDTPGTAVASGAAMILGQL